MADSSGTPARHIYFLSNRTAITAETLGHSLLAQFPSVKFETVTMPFLDSKKKAHKVVEQINAAKAKSNLIPIIISTMANEKISKIIQHADALFLDPFESFIPILESTLKSHSIHESGQSHRISNQSLYESRINAIDFSMIHDDGSTTKMYDQTDIIILGVSRTGKTPTCLYLALQFGLKAANYPITEEDMDSEDLPKAIKKFKGRLFGLTSDPNRLSHIREERRANSRYATIEQCRYEVKAAEQMFDEFNVAYINSSYMSIEEIATKIVELTGLHRISKPMINHLD